MRHDVVIIGSGYTALSAAHHLKKVGISKVQMITVENSSADETSLSEHTVISGYFDQITRIDHAFSKETRNQLIALANHSFRFLKDYLNENKIPHTEGNIKRLAQTDEEKIELEEAYELYKNFSLNPKKISWNGIDQYITGEKVLSVDKTSLLKSFDTEFDQPVIKSKIKDLKESPDYIEITLESGSTIEAEMAVLACHAEIGNVLPFYKEVLFPYADQWNKAVVGEAFLAKNEMALLKYSNMWVKSISDHEILFGGARFLRPNAGVGEMSSASEAKVSSFIAAELSKTFNVQIGEIIEGHGAVGIRACDEMPVIGPHFGSGRILLGSGFMGNPLSFGLFAGKCLADIILKGEAKTLPRAVSPDRLRSLAKKG